MNLAIIRRKFDASGGAELYTQRLLETLMEAGHEIHFYTESWPNLPSSIRVHTLNVTGGRSVRPLRFAEAVQAALDNSHHDRVLSLERTFKQNVYRAGDGVHQVWLHRRKQFSPWWKRWSIGLGAFHRNLLALERHTLDPGNTDRIIVNSEMVRSEIRGYYNYPNDRIRTVRNGIQTSKFKDVDRDHSRSGFGLNSNEFVLLFAGSGWERKGLRFALEAMKHLHSKGVRLYVAGKGRIPTSPQPGVHYLGPIQNMPQLYAAADLLICLPIYEPSANVVIEALASGLPVLTCRQNGAAEWINHPNLGRVINDPSDRVQVLESIKDFRQRRRSTISLDLGEFSIERNVKETISVLTD